jgi:hypothetical protein
VVQSVHDRAPTDGTLHALYTGLTPGLDDHPKCSRRILDSRLALDADVETIRAAIRGDGSPATDSGGPRTPDEVAGYAREWQTTGTVP